MLHKLCHILLNILHNIFIKNEWQWVLLLFFFFYTTCKIAESFKHRLQYREKIHLTRRLLSSRLTFMLNELCVIMSSVTIPSSRHSASTSVCYKPLLIQPRSLHDCHATPKLNWHCIPCENLSYTKILHSPSVEKAVRAISTSKKKKKKKRFLQEFKDCNKLAFKYRKKSVKRWGKKRKWNPVTRIIWRDDSSLVKGIGTAVLAGSPPNVIASASSQSLLFSVTLSQVIVKAEHLSAPAEKVAPPCQ